MAIIFICIVNCEDAQEKKNRNIKINSLRGAWVAVSRTCYS